MHPREIKKLQSRSRNLRVKQIAPNTLVVTSRSNPYANHIVSIETDGEGTIHARCTCPWAQNGGFGCSHVLAALSYLAQRQKRAVSFWLDLADAQRQRHRILRLAGTNGDGAIYITTRPLKDVA
ncbi:MAG: SWIM zinc finger family protein [Anaerolinea sp.]|nr:SWIM zinc finger family protein [Anaerolinea sp.]